MTPSRHGRCLCGRIGFEWYGEPNWVAYCHCESCRRNTASPATAFFGVPVSAFRWTGDTPEAYVSSPGVRRSFCARCGTPMAFEADAFPGEIHLYVATLDDPNSLRPAGHVHTGEQLDWFEILDDLPRFKGGGADREPVGHGPRKT
jgi:hypothetical protein